MKVYKATDKDMKCRGFQYTLGKTAEVDGDIELCERGLHACEMPLDVLGYYVPGDGSRYFEAELDGLSVKAFGSQGQTRTAAISLKLAERELFRRDTGEEPVLLLDDVLSELDARRQDFVLNQIRSGQVLITCCEPDRLSDIGKRILIENGQVREDPACI